MREIKFRAWLIKEKKIVVVDTISNNKGYGGALEIIIDNPLFNPNKKNWSGNNRPHDSYINHSLEIHKERNNGDDFILMQFTGLKDKNGKEIYEGDIIRVDWDDVRYKPCICQVTWDDKNACFDFGAGATGEVCWSHEIIGNIYENPELLK